MEEGAGRSLYQKKLQYEGFEGQRIAIPGELTTAYLLLQLYDPDLKKNIKVDAFNMVMDAVKKGEVDAGLIIHESRFTYKAYGLKKLLTSVSGGKKRQAFRYPSDA